MLVPVTHSTGVQGCLLTCLLLSTAGTDLTWGSYQASLIISADGRCDAQASEPRQQPDQ